MKGLARIWLCLWGLASFAAAALQPGAVAILYNSALPESRQLAETYRDARGIPDENLIGLELPAVSDLTRAEYDRLLLKPLRAQFDSRNWWTRKKDASGLTVPVANKIRVLVMMRGVPLRIKQTPQPPKPAAAPGTPPPPPPADPIAANDEACVDSELALFGVEDLPVFGVLANKFYQATRSITELEMPFLVLTARIDAPTLATCERMIRDAVETETTGLWGRAYVDVANKFPQGDQWLEAVVKANLAAGIPTVVDRFNDTLPKNYPMSDAALYYGWYDGSVSGPFLKTGFMFRKGAVAVHIHSFSAAQLTHADRNWSAPLLERGAAATVGNVHEPYLHLTHDLGLLHQRLLAGNSWVEACWMAMPVASWQGVVLGDPLYRPFLHLDGGGKKQKPDIEYRALRAASLEWNDKPEEYASQVEKAADRMSSGVLAEGLGLRLLENGKAPAASALFQKAKTLYLAPEDKLRQEFHLIAMNRASGRKDLAIRGLKDAVLHYGTLPEVEAVRGWLDILDPPPPPPADPTKAPAKPVKP